MSQTLRRFRVEKLHGIRTIDVNIEDNRLILVGENGSGKSTVANLIYFFLTRQWERMLAYDFKAILAELDSQEIELTHQELRAIRAGTNSVRRFFERQSTRVQNQLRELVASHSVDDLASSSLEIAKYARELDLPRGFIEEYIEQASTGRLLSSDKIRHYQALLESAFTEHVLYLPTYRRVEQDLASIFPTLSSSTNFKEAMERWKISAQTPDHTELVQFGMQDVEETIKVKMDEIKDNVRNDLNKLTGTYLRDIIRGEHLSVDPSVFKSLDDPTVAAIFRRIDESILPMEEQTKLRDMIQQIKAESYIRDDERVIAHFLTRLIEIHNTQQENEKDVREFVKVCNKYLSGKKFIYNDLAFQTGILQDQEDTHQEGKTSSSKEIALKMLSSGEKQIVSLFSQIYLTKRHDYFVIIDEPELSLSVLWQRQFLPDILNTKRCKGFIAVTHSPFIFENELDKYVHELDEFRENI